MALVKTTSLGKRFKYYANPRQRLLEWLTPSRPRHDARWVLRDISFEIGRGESVAFVGRNGAGKSTLLKLLTGTLLPSAGSIQVNGRISALLELGMGFHPDFSGRRNVMLAGQLLGLAKDEILSSMPAIEAFAEIGEAIDHPVRTYSSGMQVRLAFSLATVIEPDILIVDEALSVGDAYFQHKCFRRIRELREHGVTLIFVSHDPLAIKSLCNRALLLDQGRIVMDDAPDMVMDYYNALIAIDENKPDHPVATINHNGRAIRSGIGSASILAVTLQTAEGEAGEVASGQAATLEVRFRLQRPLPELTVGILIKDRLGNEIFGTNTRNLGLQLDHLEPNQAHAVRFNIDRLTLGPASYSVTVALHALDNHLEGNYDWHEQALVFRVSPDPAYSFEGVARVDTIASLNQSPS
ncbi:MAG: ABC transporter ATP-binding protein [Rhodocyclaceae bacterium]|jgi:lipopolysaccharide transport system ATP-binding protein|nr:ABC transporter ATP-binding protein [Rhodocyclaceae bacterium]